MKIPTQKLQLANGLLVPVRDVPSGVFQMHLVKHPGGVNAVATRASRKEWDLEGWARLVPPVIPSAPSHPSRSPSRARSRALACIALLAPLGAGCERVADPPGRAAYSARPARSLARPGDAAEAPGDADAGKDDGLPGHGAKIASIAMHTWIYVAPDDHSTKLGYFLRGLCGLRNHLQLIRHRKLLVSSNPC